MSYEQCMRNMELVLTIEVLNRITFNVEKNIVNIDLHGLNYIEAKKMVNNIININRREFVLIVIHGFNHGTVLKEMIMNTVWSERVVERSCPIWNPGQTFLKIVA